MQERQNTELRIAMFEHLLAQDQASFSCGWIHLPQIPNALGLGYIKGSCCHTVILSVWCVMSSLTCDDFNARNGFAFRCADLVSHFPWKAQPTTITDKSWTFINHLKYPKIEISQSEQLFPGNVCNLGLNFLKFRHKRPCTIRCGNVTSCAKWSSGPWVRPVHRGEDLYHDSWFTFVFIFEVTLMCKFHHWYMCFLSKCSAESLGFSDFIYQMCEKLLLSSRVLSRVLNMEIWNSSKLLFLIPTWLAVRISLRWIAKVEIHTLWFSGSRIRHCFNKNFLAKWRHHPTSQLIFQVLHWVNLPYQKGNRI